jgi:putative N6-adenine-specific DNA methylase
MLKPIKPNAKQEYYNFFISCPIGFETELEQEILETWPLLLDTDGRNHCFECNMEIQNGGIKINCPLHLGVQLNFFLKTAHRILLRLEEFKCKDFSKLFQRLKKIDLSQWSPQTKWYLEVAAQKSRLNNEKRIMGVIEEAWPKLTFVHSQAELKKELPQLFVRVDQDLFSISVDSTGAHLHERGSLLLRGDAPLRETLAAFCIRKMLGNLSLVETQKIVLRDPFVGSGTFLSEADQIFEPNFNRSYQFQNWKKTPALLKSASIKDNYNFKKSYPFQLLWGADHDSKVLSLAKKNLKPLTRCELIEQDVFQDFISNQDEDAISWVICNPPYGERLQLDFTIEKLIIQLKKKWQPQKMGILCSMKQFKNEPQLKKYIQESFKLKNGGIDCIFLMLG